MVWQRILDTSKLLGLPIYCRGIQANTLLANVTDIDSNNLKVTGVTVK
ncbi:MAG: hypothetical protein V7L29_30525 [Nostoc sp.]